MDIVSFPIFISIYALNSFSGALNIGRDASESSNDTERSAPLIFGPDNPGFEAGAESQAIVVTAPRYGQAEIEVEREFEESEIAAYGTENIQDLIDRLATFRNDKGEEPVILVNGKPVGFDRSFLSYPSEALERFAILKPNAAAHYGESASRRVINLTLKRNFKMSNIDAGYNFATAGGLAGGQMLLGRTAISGVTRWNIQLRATADSALKKSDRALARPAGVFDRIGYITAVDGGEIDPTLSLAAGGVVNQAAIPSSALDGPPALGDFAATTDRYRPIDPNEYETLRPRSRNYSLGFGVTRPVEDFTATLNLSVNRSESHALRGVPMVSLVVPVGAYASPFETDIFLVRPFDGVRPLRAVNRSTSIAASMNLNGQIAGAQTIIGMSYSRSSFSQASDVGIDLQEVNRLVGDPATSFNPFGKFEDSLLLTARNQSKSRNLNVRLNLRDTLITLPAGPLTWKMTYNTSLNSTKSIGDNGRGLIVDRNARRVQNSLGFGLNLPISAKKDGQGGLLGDLAIDLTAGFLKMTRNPLQRRYGANLTWTPINELSFRASLEQQELTPSYDQLDAPVVTEIQHVFDYVALKAAAPLWTTGGNPKLKRGKRAVLAFGASFTPFASRDISIATDLRRSRAKNAIQAFPELIPTTEAAFPERVLRDSEGLLIAVDARPINIDSQSDISLGTNISISRPIGTRSGSPLGGPSIPIKQPIQITASISHIWQIKNELITHPALPAVDQLKSSGQPRHNFSLQGNVGKKGLGLNLNASWGTKASLSLASDNLPGQAYVLTSPWLVNLSGFIEPEHVFPKLRASPMARGLKVTVDVVNLLDAYRRATFFDGSLLDGYTRAEVDPIGRTIRLALRKKF